MNKGVFIFLLLINNIVALIFNGSLFLAMYIKDGIEPIVKLFLGTLICNAGFSTISYLISRWTKVCAQDGRPIAGKVFIYQLAFLTIYFWSIFVYLFLV